MYNKIRHIHLIGIGGIGMSGIAQLLLREGYSVSGSDRVSSDVTKQLEAKGAKILIGHHAQNAEGSELVVYSSAIRDENPELVFAREHKILTIPRAEMLAEFCRLKWTLAIAGSHGKTTTTSMVGLCLIEAGLDPTVVVGGRVDNFGGTNARLGEGKFLVVEADESDGSFTHIPPSIAVITNIDREHLDHYDNMRNLRKSFESFIHRLPFYGLCVVNGDDPQLKLILPKVKRRILTFGVGPKNDYQILNYTTNASASLVTARIGSDKLEFKLKVPGRHNALNALATIAVADELGIARNITLTALENFEGVQRRFQKRGVLDGITLIDDYAHHPTEIRATLEAAIEKFPNSRVHAVFQPHRYSRVHDLFDEFCESFRLVESVSVTPVYAASEPPIDGVSSELLVDNMVRIGIKNPVVAFSNRDAVEKTMARCRPGDVVLTLGAGDLVHVYKDLFS